VHSPFFEWADIPPSAQARQDARTAGSRTRQRLQQAPNDMTVSIFDRQSPEWIFDAAPATCGAFIIMSRMDRLKGNPHKKATPPIKKAVKTRGAATKVSPESLHC